MIKRIFDILFAGISFLVLSPILFGLALLIKVKLGNPVLFKQLRPGLRGQPFYIYKFRTMTNCCDHSGKPLPDIDRLPPLGIWLRRNSVDELPEIFNVIKGDMSIVGPRPLLMQYLERYTPEQARRHEIKPGITGWAQVNGRNAITWEKKFKLDVWYVDNQSLALDIRIILKTVKNVLRQDGISAAGEATVAEFNPQITPVPSPGATGQAQIDAD